MRVISRLALAAAILGCADGPDGPAGTTPDAFAGEWRSVTPSLEFLRLSITSLSSQRDALGARLTFSGVAWEGGGRIEGDSLVAAMTVVGGPTVAGELVAHAHAPRTLRVQVRPTAASRMDLTFVRND